MTWLKANYNISRAEEADWADLRRNITPNPLPKVSAVKKNLCRGRLQLFSRT
jgi:hypothetical protein